MISKFLKIILSTTTLAPAFFILWLKEFSTNWHINNRLIYLIISISLIIIFHLIMQILQKKIEKFTYQFYNIKNITTNIYLLSIIYLILLFIIVNNLILFTFFLFMLFIICINLFYFNPLFVIFKYHIYYITTENNKSYLLISKRKIKKSTQFIEFSFINNNILINTKNK